MSCGGKEVGENNNNSQNSEEMSKIPKKKFLSIHTCGDYFMVPFFSMAPFRVRKVAQQKHCNCYVSCFNPAGK